MRKLLILAAAAAPSATDTSLTSTPQDTLGPRNTGVRDSTTIQGDSAATNHAVPDTTAKQ